MQDSSRPATGYPYPNPNTYPNPPPAAVNGYPPPNPGAAYPYQNPYYAQPQNHPRAALYRRLFFMFMAFLIVMGLVLLIFFFVVRPHMPDVSLTSLSVSGFNVTNSMVAGRWDLQFQVGNPNSKLSLNYEENNCVLFYDGQSLTDTRFPPFILGTKTQTPINVTMSVTQNYLMDHRADSIGKERATRGLVEFDVRLDSVVVFRYGLIRRRRIITVICVDVSVGLPANSSSGKMSGPPKECKVY